ncbi:glutaredoxin [Taylorella asinigenitalis 14/45]|uniref:Glutaredoxin n=1 Tax=Taylorella asinigenitalis 14/45 TaxID=1091495 RepID=I7JS76_9BURK|nr:Grx4 family monothiol glutaredoxin [Taylorella asinigenitalis]CCG20187.1 glutaredoxin [Taylorella asinigenitalis 14/45]
MSEIQEYIKKIVSENPVILFMKGTANAPQCGFSMRAVEALREVGVKKLATVNVLEDQEVREGIKQYANWPTIPQLYVNGEFIGGCDIILEMAESGELKEVLEPTGVLND